MECNVSIGKQNFADIRENKYFYIDKTSLIKEWWDSGDDVTLITRPRRFGKTLNMSMLGCFFSNQYAGRGDLFEGLSVWEDEKYRNIQGTYPVIFLSFADVKADNIQDAKQQVKMKIEELYRNNRYLLDSDVFDDDEKLEFRQMNKDVNDAVCSMSVKQLCNYYNRYHKKKVIVLLDEYDTPMQEAYVHGYWDEFTTFMRSFFNATFKTNPYMERAVMTGITRISKESIFSDLNKALNPFSNYKISLAHNLALTMHIKDIEILDEFSKYLLFKYTNENELNKLKDMYYKTNRINNGVAGSISDMDISREFFSRVKEPIGDLSEIVNDSIFDSAIVYGAPEFEMLKKGKYKLKKIFFENKIPFCNYVLNGENKKIKFHSLHLLTWTKLFIKKLSNCKDLDFNPYFINIYREFTAFKSKIRKYINK